MIEVIRILYPFHKLLTRKKRTLKSPLFLILSYLIQFYIHFRISRIWTRVIRSPRRFPSFELLLHRYPLPIDISPPPGVAPSAPLPYTCRDRQRAPCTPPPSGVWLSSRTKIAILSHRYSHLYPLPITRQKGFHDRTRRLFKNFFRRTKRLYLPLC